jgi:DNA end-binding protein Ku
MVQLRAGPEGIILQTLLYGNEVRSQAAIGIETPDVQPAELQLAEQLIEQYRVEGYDASEFKDEEKERILAEIDKKIAGNKITAAPNIEHPGAQVIDLVEALRASLKKKPKAEAVQPRAPRPAKLRSPLRPPRRRLRRRGARCAVPRPTSNPRPHGRPAPESDNARQRLQPARGPADARDLA